MIRRPRSKGFQIGDRVEVHDGPTVLGTVTACSKESGLTIRFDNGSYWTHSVHTGRGKVKCLEECSLTSTSSAALEDSPWLQSKLGEYKQLNLLKSTPTHKPYCAINSQVSPSIATSATIPPQLEISTFTRWDFHAQGQAAADCGMDCSIQSLPYGGKPLESSPLVDQDLLLSKIQKGLSIEDLEKFLPLSEWQAIRGTIRNSYQRLLSALPNSAKDCLLCPTPTVSWQAGHNRRPAGGNKLITWLKENGLLENGLVLNAEIVELLQGFPLGWTQILELPGGRENTLEEGSCSVEVSSQRLLRSHSDESCTCPSCERQLIKLKDGCGVCGWMSLNSVLGEIKTHLNGIFPLEPEERSPSDESSISDPSLSEGLTVNSNQSSAISNQILSVSQDLTGKEQSPTVNNYSSAVLGETQSLSPLRQRVSVLRCDLHWAQDLVTLRHYLHRPIHLLSLPFAYSINLDGEPVGCIIMATPHFTKKKDLFGYDGLPTKWQVLQIARLWLDPSVQVRASNGHASCIASCAIAKVLKRVQTDWLEHHPPRFPDQPYQIRFILAYADTGVGHQGTIYKAANFKFWGETNKGKPRYSTGGQTSGSTKLLYVYRLPESKERDLLPRETQQLQIEFPLEPEEGRQGDKGRSPTANNYSAVRRVKPTRASGWLEGYTKNKKLKNGTIATYPRVLGERDPDNPEQWYWAYRWEEKKKENQGYITRAVSCSRDKVEAVELAIALRWSVEKILSFLRNDL